MKSFLKVKLKGAKFNSNIKNNDKTFSRLATLPKHIYNYKDFETSLV